jgi:hypothetical protein
VHHLRFGCGLVAALGDTLTTGDCGGAPRRPFVKTGGIMSTFQKIAAVVNTGFRVVARIPVLDKIIGKAITTITYTGRKSGKTFSIPVAYKRSGDDVIIGVAMPDKKTWWRNFSGAGAPISIELDGVD